jgi:hypothetical protein
MEKVTQSRQKGGQKLNWIYLLFGESGLATRESSQHCARVSISESLKLNHFRFGAHERLIDRQR